jgi:hypothetical protein
MKIEPSVSFKYYVYVDAQTLKALVMLGLDHYDDHCRRSAQNDGFIAIWYRIMIGANGWIPPDYIEASWREIDTCCKILEMIPHSPRGKYDESSILLLLNLRVSFDKLLRHSHNIWDDIQPFLNEKTEF